MTLPNLTPEQVNLYLQLIGGALGIVTTIAVGTVLPALRNFKTAQAAAPAQAASDMVTSASKMAASVALATQDKDKALAAGVDAGLKMLMESGIWPTVAKHFPREQLVAAFTAYIAAKAPAVVALPNGVDTSAKLEPGVKS